MFLVAIEGVDGAGKTTQADLLRANLAAGGVGVKLRSFPVYDSFIGRQIAQILRSDSPLDVRSTALWFAADRRRALEHEPLAADVEICNRYTLSNAVYQSSRASESERQAVFEWVLELEQSELAVPVPDLTLVLDVTPALVEERTRVRAERAGTEPDAYERLSGLQDRVRAGYLAAAERSEAIVVIPCDRRAADDIAADVLAELRRRAP